MLTNENYFSVENNMKYMGSTQYKTFCECEAKGLAEARGEYKRPESTALLVGSYVDAHFSGELDLFRAKNPSIFRRDGQLRADFAQANEIISRLEDDRLYSLMMSGKQQVIRTGFIAGVPFKIKIDSLLDGNTVKQIVSEFPQTEPFFAPSFNGAVVDGKIMRDFKEIFNPETRTYEPFPVFWGYDIQGAIYTAVEGNSLPFFIAAATKESVANFAVMSIPNDVLQAKLYEVEDNAPHFRAIKQGKVDPTPCGKCDYCISKKILTTIIDFREISV